MKDIVIIENGDGYTNTKVVSDMLKTGSKNDKNIHGSIMRTLKEQVLGKYDSIKQWSTGQQTIETWECSITGALFVSGTVGYGDNNLTTKVYKMNETAFHLLVTHITRYQNARAVNLQFIKAFKLLKQEYLTRDNKVLNEIVNKDELGKKSEVNSLPRTKQVRGYYRSKNGKDLSQEINQTIKKTQLNLFTYQDRIEAKE